MSAINNRQHFNIVVDCHGIMGFISPPSYIRQNTTVKMRASKNFTRWSLLRKSPAEKEKARRRRACLTNISSIGLFRELCDLMREPRDLSARIVLVDDVALRSLHELRLRTRHRRQRRIAVAALDRLFD